MNLFNTNKDDYSQDKKIVDTIRSLGIDMINSAKSGHPGIVLGAAPIIYTLFAYHLNIDYKHPTFINRDRFILSCGHGSALLYSTLYMAGADISLDDLKKFRHLDSKAQGHPIYNPDLMVEATTGPLGQGLGMAVGMALGEEYLRSQIDLINHYTYVLCSDGDLMEGISYEALSLAGHLNLNKLIILYDSNNVTLDGKLDLSFSENIKGRVESSGFNYILVNDGEDIGQINDAINKAKNSDKPTFIQVKTILGHYSKYEGTNTVHGKPLEEEDIKLIKEKLNLRDSLFSPSSEVKELFQSKIRSRCDNLYDIFIEKADKLPEDKKELLNSLQNYKEPVLIKDLYYDLSTDKGESTRVTSGKILNAYAKNYPLLLGGSADISASTYGIINGFNTFNETCREGRNIYYGVREHAMGAISNGLALMGLTSFASTLLVFSDYMYPSIRLSAMMNLPVIYLFSHDSITVGEDGETHQPIEQLANLRNIKGLDVYRPGDANEVLGSYRSIFETRRPSAILLCRNEVEIKEETSVKDVQQGAYVLLLERRNLQGIIISSGEELSLAIKVYQRLTEKGYGIRLVSMPCSELFDRQTNKYQEKILPKESEIKRFVISLSSKEAWYKYVNDKDNLFTVDDYGKSAPYKDLYEYFNLTVEKIENAIIKKLN